MGLDNSQISDFEKFERQLVTFETSPSVTGGLLPELQQSDWAIKHAFNEASLSIITKEGVGDVIGVAVNNAYQQKSETLFGTFEGNYNPTNIFQMAETFQEQSLASKSDMDCYCAVAGIAFEQDAVPYMRAEKGREENADLSFGIQLDFEKEFDTHRFRMLAAHFRDHAEGFEFTVVEPNSVRFVNFRDESNVPFLMDDASFVAKVMEAAESLPFEDKVSVLRMRVSGNYIFNDWSENKNGESYAQLLKDNGRDDLVTLAYDLRQDFLNHVKDFATQYGMIEKKVEPTLEKEESGLSYG